MHNTPTRRIVLTFLLAMAATLSSRAADAATAPKVSGKERPDLALTESPGGKQLFQYKANLQEDKGAKDALSTGEFREMGPGSGHVNGIAGAPTVYSFELPGPIESVAASATFGNHVDGNEHSYSIAYSTDGNEFQPLVEKATNQTDNITVEGQADLRGQPRKIWVRFDMTHNPFITLKQVAVTLTVAK